MSVIVELQVPGEEFQLGRVLQVGADSHVELDTTVPTGGRAVPFFWVYDGDLDRFEAAVADHEVVDALRAVDSFEDRTLYALEWRAAEDDLLTAVSEHDAQLLAASRTDGVWDMELRFPTHDALSAFQSATEEAGIPISVQRIYSPTEPDAERSYGLTAPQREALELAVESGYYAIPRRATTVDLADRLGVSDQAVIERLRRGIDALVSNALLTDDD